MRSNRQILIAGTSLLMASATISCAPKGELPDLVPERLTTSTGRAGFCKLDDQGRLQVRVRNQANPDVLVQTTTTVEFQPGGPVSHATAPMPGGSFAEPGPFDIPGGCFNPDCSFVIKVDAGEEVSEFDENNNAEQGICIG